MPRRSDVTSVHAVLRWARYPQRFALSLPLRDTIYSIELDYDPLALGAHLPVTAGSAVPRTKSALSVEELVAGPGPACAAGRGVGEVSDLALQS